MPEDTLAAPIDRQTSRFDNLRKLFGDMCERIVMRGVLRVGRIQVKACSGAKLLRGVSLRIG